ncbi:MAG: hypothetical protein PHS64_07005, partial [Candidatus Omnitrophica bacterium]|nr:hypothetical protein [Candidatus Omnitrophota bacterium]
MISIMLCAHSPPDAGCRLPAPLYSLPDPGNLEGTSYPYKNSYPFGETLHHSYRSHLYAAAVPIAN